MSERFAHLAGDRVLDVVNTVDWRLDETRSIEQLEDLDSVIAWCEEAGFLDAAEGDRVRAEAERHPVKSRRTAEAFRTLRDDAYLALAERDPAAANRVADRARAGAVRAELVLGDGVALVWQDLRVGLDTPVDRVARALVELLTSERVELLHRCEDDVCGWLYLDTSPRHNRRWCAASDCGDRNRARAYYRRKKKA